MATPRSVEQRGADASSIIRSGPVGAMAQKQTHNVQVTTMSCHERRLSVITRVVNVGTIAQIAAATNCFHLALPSGHEQSRDSVCTSALCPLPLPPHRSLRCRPSPHLHGPGRRQRQTYHVRVATQADAAMSGVVPSAKASSMR